MNPAKKAIKLLDQFQKRLRGLSFLVGVWKKFNDDQAGNLAALIAYYGFVSIFPLLLILFTVLNIVLRDNQSLQNEVISSALTDYPGFGSLLQDSVKSFNETGPALVVGVILTVLGTRGVANAIQNALNSVWEVPREHRPRFPWSWLRSFGLILVVGLGEIAISVASGFVSAATFLPGFALKAAGTAVTLVFNIGLFWLAFRLATAKAVTWRDLRARAQSIALRADHRRGAGPDRVALPAGRSHPVRGRGQRGLGPQAVAAQPGPAPADQGRCPGLRAVRPGSGPQQVRNRRRARNSGPRG
jgi:YihY family inner membrane protein